jgi:hypothetical protein
VWDRLQDKESEMGKDQATASATQMDQILTTLGADLEHAREDRRQAATVFWFAFDKAGATMGQALDFRNAMLPPEDALQLEGAAPLVVARIVGLIEQARATRQLGNDQARAASVVLALEGDDAMLANRLISQGADPASLDYIDTGEVTPKIRQAHRNGPGVYEPGDPERMDYLALCALSADESQGTGTVRERLWVFFEAMRRLNHEDPEFQAAAMAELGRRELAKIENLPYSVATVGGRSMRVYVTDRGFAAAAWDGECCAAVLGRDENGPYLAVGAPPYANTLAELGVEIDKAISDRFGIVTDESAVTAVVKETGLEA